MENHSEGRYEIGTAAGSPGVEGAAGTELPWGFHPNALLVHWEIYARTQRWRGALASAQALVLTLPREPIGWIYRSFALQQLGLVQEAREALLPAARQFPSDWRIAYNLACYCSQLGDRAGAWNWLDQAIEKGDADAIKSLALEEESFRFLWERLGKL